MAILYTIGHSTRLLEELIRVLDAHSVQTLVDIRAFPMSRRLPHFNRDHLEQTFPASGIRYLWMKALGGYRKQTIAHSPNRALRNQSFRNYADYMLGPEFQSAAEELVNIAERSRTAYMCAERVYFRCHRMLVSDYLVAHGHEVQHIDATGPTSTHQMTGEARLIEGQLIYPADPLG